MKFSFGNNYFENVSPSLRKEITEKLLTAEKNLGFLRLLVISINACIYLLFMNTERSRKELAYSIIAVSLLYSLVVVIFEPYRKYHLLRQSYFTSGTDALLITLWILATGGPDSPFYQLWYLSIVATAMRYTFRVTMRVAVLYCLLYLAVFLLQAPFMEYAVDILTRCSYIFLIALGSGLLAKEAIGQIQDKITIQKSREEIRKRKEQLIQANEKLEERVKDRTKKLKENNQELMRINEDIDNFVYAASHDLKAPIQNVQALLGLLFENEASPDEETREIREKIYAALGRVMITIGHLSEIAKAHISLEEDISHVQFDEVLKEVIADNEETLKKHQAIILQNFDRAQAITYSKTSLKSIFNNFITNSVKYKAPERKPVIEIQTDVSGEHLVLSIKDNGLGIDLNRHGSKLFTVFKRFHTHVEGAGIGLYMVKRMVERNRGKIEVESEPDKGTTFHIKFLLQHPSANQN